MITVYTYIYKVIRECHYKGCLNLIWPPCSVKIANVIIKWRLKSLTTNLRFIKVVPMTIQYTLANPNRCFDKKKSVPISEFVRISEVIHLYGEFCSESL